MTTTKTKAVKRFNMSKQPVATATGTLDESDFLSEKEIEDGSIEDPLDALARPWIGLEVSVRQNLSMDMQFKFNKLLNSQGEPNVEGMENSIQALAKLIPSIVVSWNLDETEGKMLPVTAENILGFGQDLFAALIKTMTKASQQGRLTPNS